MNMDCLDSNTELLDLLIEALEPIRELRELLMELINNCSKIIYRIINSLIINQSFAMDETYIPNIIIYDSNHCPNAPPQEASSVFNEAIENMMFNIARMKNFKSTKFIKKHFLAICKGIFYKIITDLIFKLFSM